MKKLLLAAAGAAALLVAGAASAAEHEVRMLNRGAQGAMVFEPQVLRIAPGDKVRFVPVDKGHNAESLEGMTPEGAAPFKGKMNEALTVVFEKPGVYGYQCRPHYAMGMVGLIVVGDAAVNLDAAKAVTLKGRAKARMAEAFAALESGKLAQAE